MLKKQVCLIVMIIMSLCMFSVKTNAQEVSDAAGGIYDVDVFGHRNALIQKMTECSEEGGAKVQIGNYAKLDYQYNFSCSEGEFAAVYKLKENGWFKYFTLAYNYETDLVDIKFQQSKSGYFYAAYATFAASGYTDVYSIEFKDATASDYGGMCVTYAENFAKVVVPSINFNMMNYFNSSLCKIGFTSYKHNHSGGSATCVTLAKCQICDKEYGEFKDHVTEIVNKKQETCYEEGYTGDQMCTVCGEIIQRGTVIPVKERVEATGKFALLKSFLNQKGLTDDNGNRYFIYQEAGDGTKAEQYASITYLEDVAQFEFYYLTISSDTGIIAIKMNIEENGSEQVTVYYSYETVSLNAAATFEPQKFTAGGMVYFEKTSSNILENYQIQKSCNLELQSAFYTWDILLLRNFGLDINMADLGFVSYEEAGTHTWDLGEVTTEATCGKLGVRTYTCKICGNSKTEEIEKTNVHTWDFGMITTQATAVNEGIKTYTCTVCKTTRTEVIPKKVENDGSNDNNKTKKSQNIKVTTTKTISAKKLKKKAQTFSLSAKSTSGNKVKYKLVNKNKNIKFSSSGKITVKKGTKKGTYKIKVKMTVSGNDKYKPYSKSKTITIKVK